MDYKTTYPALFTSRNRALKDEFIVMDALPPEELIGNVYMVGESEGKLLYIIQENDRIEIPGGKKDPGENHLETIKREMLEEAGAEVKSFTAFGAWHLLLKKKNPLYPHLPFPDYYMLVGFGKIDIVSEPTNPIDSRDTITVKLEELEEVKNAFSIRGRKDLADLYQLAWNTAEKTNLI